jgi:hypothetical protein
VQGWGEAVPLAVAGALDQPPVDLRPVLAQGVRLAAAPPRAAAAGGTP